NYMKKSILALLVILVSSSAFAEDNCSKEIIEAAKQADGRQSPNCVVTIHAQSVDLGSHGMVDVSCPAFIPGNPTAPTHYWTRKFLFTVLDSSCNVAVRLASSI